MRAGMTVPAVSLLLLALAGAPWAQDDVARIANLSTSGGPTPASFGLREGLAELGYRENEDYFMGHRFTQGDMAALTPAARQLVDYGVDVLYVNGANAARAARTATSRIPIVCLCDPVTLGLAESMARPSGNVTGVSDLDRELGPKRLQILTELVPGVRRLLYVYVAADYDGAEMASGYRSGAEQLGLELRVKVIHTAHEARALARIGRGEVDAILVPSLPALNVPGFLLEVSNREGIPAMFTGGNFWVEQGGLISYGADFHESGRLAARMVHKILNGADPASIPVEANPAIKLNVNAATAASMGIEIPPALLLRADTVVE